MSLKKQSEEVSYECDNAPARHDTGGKTVTETAAAVDLTRLGNGEAAIIVEHQGGGKSASVMKAMGILPGTKVTKKCSTSINGPIVLEKDGVQIAIGKSAARKIIVKPVTRYLTNP